jgi:predicted nucleotidyltransferase
VNLSDPITSVVPSAHGAVLRVLARTNKPLSGRRIAELTDGKVGRSRVNQILGELTEAGVVLRESHPPAHVYELNELHVAWLAIMMLADLRSEMLRKMTRYLAEWRVNVPLAVWLFGSAARGDGGVHSDIDLLVVRPDDIDDDDPEWGVQLGDLAEYVTRLTGNSCEIIDLSLTETVSLEQHGERLAHELREDAIALLGDPPDQLLRAAAHKTSAPRTTAGKTEARKTTARRTSRTVAAGRTTTGHKTSGSRVVKRAADPETR